jgi:hypothetical protein
MSTYLCFAATSADGNLALLVTEGPDAVLEAMTAAGGLPFRLTRRKDGVPIYVNPASVAYWVERVDR